MYRGHLVGKVSRLHIPRRCRRSDMEILKIYSLATESQDGRTERAVDNYGVGAMARAFSKWEGGYVVEPTA